MITAKSVIGWWRAGDNNLEIGKHMEYEIEEILTDRNQRFQNITFFKPYPKKLNGNLTGEWGKQFTIDFPRGIPVLIERINHAIMKYGARNGQYVFQPMQAQQPVNVGSGQQQQLPGQAAPQLGYQPPAPQYQPQGNFQQPAAPMTTQPQYQPPQGGYTPPAQQQPMYQPQTNVPPNPAPVAVTQSYAPNGGYAPQPTPGGYQPRS